MWKKRAENVEAKRSCGYDPLRGCEEVQMVLSSSCKYIHGAEKLWEGYAYNRQGRRPRRWDDLATARRLKQNVLHHCACVYSNKLYLEAVKQERKHALKGTVQKWRGRPTSSRRRCLIIEAGHWRWAEEEACVCSAIHKVVSIAQENQRRRGAFLLIERDGRAWSGGAK